MDVDTENADLFPQLQFNTNGIISVNFYNHAIGWDGRQAELESIIRRHLDRENIDNNVSILHMEALEKRLYGVLGVLRNAVCYPAPETVYPSDAEGLISLIINFAKFMPKDVIELSNEVYEMVHTIEKLELTASCLSASHDYAKYFFGDVLKLAGVNIDRVLAVFATCITRLNLANRQILIASFKAGFSNKQIRDTMVTVISSEVTYNVVYETEQCSGKIYDVIKTMPLPIAQYILYLQSGKPVDIQTTEGMEFNLIGADIATSECASQCMKAYTALVGLRGFYNSEIATDAPQENYVNTEGLYTYTMRLNNLINQILHDAQTQTIIPMCEKEDIRTIGSVLGCETLNVKSEADIVQSIRDFGATILNRSVEEDIHFNLFQTVNNELQRRDSLIHTSKQDFDALKHTYDDTELAHQQKSEIISRCVEKLNKTLSNNDARPNGRQASETNIECIVNRACEEIHSLYTTNVRLKNTASHQTDRADAADATNGNLQKIKTKNKNLQQQFKTLQKQSKTSIDQLTTELEDSKGEFNRLSDTMRTLHHELDRLRTELRLKDESIVAH
ncbi:hypothetical protein MHBO_001579 [Bonamia ostreae]|uniref:Uncharacterized protein n=1 Tax=Bonamia ostreae TaxID=126728 RepID=A0ABV2AK17_9EUKA